jgi:hypothetical protein
MYGEGIDEAMTRFVSLLLLVVVALGAGSELAWAEETQEIRVETNGVELPLTQDVEDVEVGDEVVLSTRSGSLAGGPRPILSSVLCIETASGTPPTQPPRA